MNKSQGPTPKAALTVSDFCAMYSIGRSTFYEEVKAGRIKILKAGKRTLIAASEGDRWLATLSA